MSITQQVKIDVNSDDINLEQKLMMALDNFSNFDNEAKEVSVDNGIYERDYINSLLDEYKLKYEMEFRHDLLFSHNRRDKTRQGSPHSLRFHEDKYQERFFIEKLIEKHGVAFVLNISKIYFPFTKGLIDEKNKYKAVIAEYIKTNFGKEHKKNFWDRSFSYFIEKNNDKEHFSLSRESPNLPFYNHRKFWHFVYKYVPEIVFKMHKRSFGNDYTNTDIGKRFFNNFTASSILIFPFQDSIKDFENGSLFGIKNKLSEKNWINFLKNYNAEQMFSSVNGDMSCSFSFEELDGNISFFAMIKNSVIRDKNILLSIPSNKLNNIIHSKKTSKATILSILALLNYIQYDMSNIKQYKNLHEERPKYEIEKYMNFKYEFSSFDYVSIFENIRKNDTETWNKVVEDINKTKVFNLLDDYGISFEMVEYWYDYIKNKKRYIKKFTKIMLSSKYKNDLSLLKIL